MIYFIFLRGRCRNTDDALCASCASFSYARAERAQSGICFVYAQSQKKLLQILTNRACATNSVTQLKDLFVCLFSVSYFSSLALYAMAKCKGFDLAHKEHMYSAPCPRRRGASTTLASGVVRRITCVSRSLCF